MGNIYQYNFTILKVKKILSEKYSSLGKVNNIRSFKNNGQNSIIFYFFCNKKKYLIKIIPNPDEIYGKKNGQKRIFIITNIIKKLSEKYQLEKFIKNDFNKYSTNYKKSIIRVTEYVEPKKNKNNILKESTQILNKIHKNFWKELDVNDKNNLKSFNVPYNLKYTFSRNKIIKNFFDKIIKKIEIISIQKILKK